MDMIKAYSEKIAIFVVISAYIDLIMPNNSYRKYLRLIVGAMLVSMVIEPISILLERWKNGYRKIDTG